MEWYGFKCHIAFDLVAEGVLKEYPNPNTTINYKEGKHERKTSIYIEEKKTTTILRDDYFHKLHLIESTDHSSKRQW